MYQCLTWAFFDEQGPCENRLDFFTRAREESYKSDFPPPEISNELCTFPQLLSKCHSRFSYIEIDAFYLNDNHFICFSWNIWFAKKQIKVRRTLQKKIIFLVFIIFCSYYFLKFIFPSESNKIHCHSLWTSHVSDYLDYTS